MSICLVIPTMKRTHTGFEYISTTLSTNASLYRDPTIFRTVCIYAHKEDEETLCTYIKKANNNDLVDSKYTFIERVSHDDILLNDFKFSKDSYPYWRTHLCMDFVCSMTKAMDDVDTTSEYFMWLEDDTRLISETGKALASFLSATGESFEWTPHCGIGATCLLFKRDTLVECCKLIRAHWHEDIPMDWMYRFFPKPSTTGDGRTITKIGRHLGEISSRADRVKRVVEK